MIGVDMFCGVGGLSKGLCSSGVDVVAAYDFWDVAVKTYNRNMNHPARIWSGQKGGAMRHLREIARHVRSLYDVLNTGDFDYEGTYKGMALGGQTDKAFSMSGTLTRKYLQHQRLVNPSLSKDTLKKIILNGGQYELKPERRFDAAVVSYLT